MESHIVSLSHDEDVKEEVASLMPEDRIFKVITKDGESFDIAEALIRESEFLKTAYEGDIAATEVHAKEVSAEWFRHTISFLELNNAQKIKSIDKPLRDTDLRKCGLQEQFAKYIDQFSIDQLCDLINTANYLHINDLIALCAAAIAAKIKGKTREEVKALLGITEDPADESDNKDDQ